MGLSNFTKEALEQSIQAMLEEKKKIESVIALLRQTIVQTNGSSSTLTIPKKVDGRSASSRNRMLKVWELARRLEAPSIVPA